MRTILNISVSADSGNAIGFKKIYSLFSFLSVDAKTRDFLVYIALAIILVTLIALGIVLVFKLKERKEEKDQENKIYQENYAKIITEKKRRDKLQEEYDRRVNQEDGYEDLLIQMVKSNDDKDAREVLLDFLEEKNINPEDVTLEFSVSRSKRSAKHSEDK